MKIGAQFYSLRDFCKTPNELSDTLAKIADIGYSEIQLSGVCEFEPEWMADELRKNGLKCILTHTAPTKITADAVAVCNDHKIFDCHNIGLGGLPGMQFTLENYSKFKEDFLPIAKIFKENGCRLFYHNHYQEFWRQEDGTRIFDRLLADFPAELMSITLDTYWMQFSGNDPVKWIRELKGRMECIHLKDMSIVGWEQRMSPVGSGNMNFDAILCAAKDVGTSHIIVEQDEFYGEDPFECLKKSYLYLRSLGYN